MSSDGPCVSVIIAAYNAEQTVAIAVKSALDEPQVGEVVLVDDCSSDETCARALAVAGGDARLKVVPRSMNHGPASARNLALSKATMPLIALLDADDAFVPGRLARLPDPTLEWDFWADNLLFVKKSENLVADLGTYFDIDERYVLDTSSFIQGNIPKRGMLRAELGFLKPVFRRSFVQNLGLLYRENCRLGEDFLFYTEALSAGAKFIIDGRCGYRALHRSNSLSGLHSVQDLVALYDGVSELLERLAITRGERSALERHRRSLEGRIAHRQVLTRRAQFGLLRGIASLVSKPGVVFAILNDWFNPITVDNAELRPLLTQANLQNLHHFD